LARVAAATIMIRPMPMSLAFSLMARSYAWASANRVKASIITTDEPIRITASAAR
jgi:hypothetical protein